MLQFKETTVNCLSVQNNWIYLYGGSIDFSKLKGSYKILKTFADEKLITTFNRKSTMSFNPEIYRCLVLSTPLNSWSCHCVKMSVFRVVLVRIQSECGKIRTRITPNTDTFHAVCFSEKFIEKFKGEINSCLRVVSKVRVLQINYKRFRHW